MDAERDLRFSLRPVFVGWIAFLAQLPLQIFFTIWTGGFFGGLFTSFGFIRNGSPAPFIFFGAIGFIGVPVVAYMGKKLNYARTEYRFFDDRVEFEEGFFTINKKVIAFRDVREVTLRRGFLQRMYGLGSVYLATQATGSSGRANPFGALGFGNVSASGVLVRDVPDPEAAYEQVRAMVEAVARRDSR